MDVHQIARSRIVVSDMRPISGIQFKGNILADVIDSPISVQCHVIPRTTVVVGILQIGIGFIPVSNVWIHVTAHIN